MEVIDPNGIASVPAVDENGQIVPGELPHFVGQNGILKLIDQDESQEFWMCSVLFSAGTPWSPAYRFRKVDVEVSVRRNQLILVPDTVIHQNEMWCRKLDYPDEYKS